VAEKPQECRARVLSVRARAPEVLEARLGMEEPRELPFAAGQWVSIPLGPRAVRAYSIASTPRERREIALAADVAPAGIGSRWFRSLAPGDEVRFKGPLGGFVLPPGEGRRPLIRSILMDLAASGFHRPAQLVYRARRPQGLVYDEEFRALAEDHPGFAYHPLVEVAEPSWAGAVGALAELVDRLTPTVENLVVYVAGGEQAIHSVRDALVAKGLERKAVRWEKFW
jgi:NAD(P)H-flavin reductase